MRRLLVTLLSTLLVASLIALVPVAAVAKDKTKDACKGDGWTQLVDENGEDFTSKKACTALAAEGGTPVPECTHYGVPQPYGGPGGQQPGEVWCGTPGDDGPTDILTGVTFIGYGGNDRIQYLYGTFYGGDGDDTVGWMQEKPCDLDIYFDGGAGNDTVQYEVWCGTTINVETINGDMR